MIIRRLPSLPSWTSAIRELDQARQEMQRLFGPAASFGRLESAGVFPAINVTETGEAVLVRAELPGVRVKDLDVSMENNTLTIAGERQAPSLSEGVSYHRREREWGTFRRSISLPTRVNAETVRARYVDGVLTVELLKAAEARPRQIAVQRDGSQASEVMK